MSFHLTAGVVKKIGLPAYSSFSASCQVECQLDGAATSEAHAAFQQRVAEVYRLCEEAVLAELSRHVPGSEDPPHGAARPAESKGRNGNGREGGPTNGRHPDRPLSSRQQAYLERMALRIPDLGMERFTEFVAEAFGRPLGALSMQEASRLIDTLAQVETGEILLENAAPLIA